MSLKNNLNLNAGKSPANIPVLVPPVKVTISYNATEAAIKKALAPEPASGGKKFISFADDDLEERVGNIVGGMLSQEAVAEVLNTSIDDIEKMDIEQLDEIA